MQLKLMQREEGMKNSNGCTTGMDQRWVWFGVEIYRGGGTLSLLPLLDLLRRPDQVQVQRMMMDLLQFNPGGRKELLSSHLHLKMI